MPCGPEQNYKLTPAQLDAALARKPKVFLFNNPSNPTGMVYTGEEIAALAEVLVKHPDTWVITDDIYNSMVFDGIGYHNFVFARPELRERVIFVDSVSKTYGMPGWRVGLLAGPEVGGQGDHHAQLQPHHQPAGSDHGGGGGGACPARRMCRSTSAPSLPASATRCSPRSARFPA